MGWARRVWAWCGAKRGEEEEEDAAERAKEEIATSADSHAEQQDGQDLRTRGRRGRGGARSNQKRGSRNARASRGVEVLRRATMFMKTVSQPTCHNTPCITYYSFTAMGSDKALSSK